MTMTATTLTATTPGCRSLIVECIGDDDSIIVIYYVVQYNIEA